MKHFIEKCGQCYRIIKQCKCFDCNRAIIISICNDCSEGGIMSTFINNETSHMHPEDVKDVEIKQLKQKLSAEIENGNALVELVEQKNSQITEAGKVNAELRETIKTLTVEVNSKTATINAMLKAANDNLLARRELEKQNEH